VHPEDVEDTEKKKVEFDGENALEGIQSEQYGEDQNNNNIRCRES